MQSTLQEKHVIKQKYTSPFSNFDMYDKKDNTEHNADWSNNKVTNSKKRILSTKPGCCCQDHSLSSIEWWHWICCMQKKHNLSSG